MTRLNTGGKALQTAILVLKVLRAAAQDPDLRLDFPRVQVRWYDSTSSTLIVKLRIRDLIHLTRHLYPQDPIVRALSPEDIKEVFKNLAKLNLFQDTRIQRRGIPDWTFTLSLGSRQLEAVVTEVDTRWPELKSGGPQQSKQQREYLWSLPRTKEFVNRQPIVQAITQFMDYYPRGYIVIEGPPGSGKTSLVADYAHRTPCIPLFISPERGNTSPRLLVLLSQMARERYSHPQWESWIQDIEQDPLLFWDYLQVLAAHRVSQSRDRSVQEPIIIVLDGLDELALTLPQPDLIRSATNLLSLPTELPDQVYIIVTQRPMVPPLVTHTPIKLIQLSDYRQQTDQAISTYIDHRIQQSVQLQDWMRHQHFSKDKAIENLQYESQGNFMVLQALLEHLQSSPTDSITALPTIGKLEAYYHRHWQQMQVSEPSRLRLRILAIFSACQSPISCSSLAAALGEDPILIQEILDEWQPFLHHQPIDQDPHYHIYHPYFQRYLSRQDMIRMAQRILELDQFM